MPVRVVVEVQRVDVLVLLGRVLGVGDGAVGPGGEPLRVLFDPRVIGRGLQGQVERDLHARARGCGPRTRRSPRTCPGPGGSRRARRRRTRSPTASRDRPSCGVSVLFRPLRNVIPIGCTGGRYTTSKPMPATASSRRAAVRSVPETGGRWPVGSTWAPSDRGKNSYHDAVQGPLPVRLHGQRPGPGDQLAQRPPARMAAMTGSSAAASRVPGGSPRSRSRATSARSAVRAAAGRLAPAAAGSAARPARTAARPR